MTVEGFIKKIKQRALTLKKEVFALYYAYQDPRVPWLAKVWIAVVVGYAFSPIDLIPDFIPVIGLLDDLLLVPIGIAIALKMIPPEVMIDARAKAEQSSTDKRTSWVAASIIVGLWIFIAWVIWRAVVA